ncbi:MAG: twin-arginine translocase subunit TatC [Blastocatellia bacterium]|nr:twin-arginine translocase subunit TatC [Blastocatellia bacterium]HBE81814.1 twin-arginine translocase subunit TatC [Blastocatellia bacterium]HRK50008.1 twin-arginine translocase subunit TatC [Pyrinomonadaceae bacterium]
MPDIENEQIAEVGVQMSFLDHLDELRRRLVNSVIFVVIAFVCCWFVSKPIYNFLSVPIRQALSEAERRDLPVEGRTGEEKILPLSTLKPGDRGRFVFDRATKLGISVVQPGTTVDAVVTIDADGRSVLYTEQPIFTVNAVIPAGVRLPVDLAPDANVEASADERLIVTTAQESFTLYVTVSLYAAIAVSIPFLLLQIWGFVSPALYKHERSYVTPFILLSSVSFVGGVAFAYYILFPPAVRYLLGLGEDFRLLLRASDYFDLITLIMLAMGIIFQMPAVAYVLARIGIISATLLIKSWKIALVAILIVAAIVSPTGDIPNLMLFATPMMVLYIFSIFIAWFFGKERRSNDLPAV